MSDRPEWEPDADYHTPKIVLSDAALLRDDEEQVPQDEYGERQKKAEQQARQDLIDYWKRHEHDVGALRKKKERLSKRWEKEARKKAQLGRKRAAAQLAARAAEMLAEKYGSETTCNTFFHVVGPAYEENLPDGRTTRWRRTDNALIALTVQGEVVFDVVPEATFAELRRTAQRTVRRLKEPWLKTKKVADYLHLRAAICESLLYEIDLYGEPCDKQEEIAERTSVLPSELRSRASGYQHAYRVGLLLDERGWPENWEPSSFKELRQAYAERFGGIDSNRALAGRLEEATLDGEVFKRSLGQGGGTDAERASELRRTCELCQQCYRLHRPER
jgi:hypothetical protein